MAFTPKAWVNGSATTGRLDAAAMIDLETRLAAYSEYGAMSGNGMLGNVVAPHHPHLMFTNTAYTANDARSVRVVMPKDGLLQDMAIWVAGTTSGNIDIGIYDCAATTATKLYSSGSVACGSINAWQVVGNPNLNVTAGQHLDFVLACDNATALFGRTTAPVSNLIVQLPTNYMVGAGALPKTAWRAVTAFPLPSTISEANKTVTGGAIPFIMARIT